MTCFYCLCKALLVLQIAFTRFWALRVQDWIPVFCWVSTNSVVLWVGCPAQLHQQPLELVRNANVGTLLFSYFIKNTRRRTQIFVHNQALSHSGVLWSLRGTVTTHIRRKQTNVFGAATRNQSPQWALQLLYFI